MELAEPEATASVLAEAGVLRAATFHIYILLNTHVMFARTVHIHLYLHKTIYIYIYIYIHASFVTDCAAGMLLVTRYMLSWSSCCMHEIDQASCQAAVRLRRAACMHCILSLTAAQTATEWQLQLLLAVSVESTSKPFHAPRQHLARCHGTRLHLLSAPAKCQRPIQRRCFGMNR